MANSLAIRSGGQTGVDRAAVDVALQLGLRVQGWCPRGGWAEDKTSPPGLLADYPFFQETPSARPEERTEWNVRDSDGTLVLVRGNRAAHSKGTQYTVQMADRYDRPCLIAELPGCESEGSGQIAFVRAWIGQSGIVSVLNIAGPRESEENGIYDLARQFLIELLGSSRS